MTTLLVIGEDRATVEEVLRPALANDEFQVELVSSIDQASRLLAERGASFDAVVIDWSVLAETLPDDTLPAWVRQQVDFGQVEILVHARTFDPDHVDRVMTSGAYYFLTRPYSSGQVQGIVRAAVATCRLKRALAVTGRRLKGAATLLAEAHYRVRTPADADALAAYLGAACGDGQQGIGFLELLRNAVEHGNLGISYEEKGALLAQRRFGAEVARRLSTAPWSERVADVTVRATDDRLEVEIVDQGAGFDYQRYLVMTPDRVFDTHGRGVLLASVCLDLEYSPPGNRVRAVARR